MSGIKDLAKHMRKARIAPRRSRPRESEDEVLTPETPPLRPQGFAGEIPDAWDTKYRPDVEQKAREVRQKKKRKELEEERVEDEVPDPEGYRTVKRRLVSTKKRRTSQISICVSEEEESLLRDHVTSLDSSLSAWVRQVCFRAMGRKVPSRPKRGG